MIEVRNEFRVPADPETVYDYLLALEQVGECIPGAQVGPAGDDGAHPAQIAVKLGPMRFSSSVSRSPPTTCRCSRSSP